MSSPEVSLVLPCYNEADNIAEVIDESTAALEASGESWELIVVDNHSSDATPTIVNGLTKFDSRIRLIVHECNKLYSGSCQTGLTQARGRYVAIMDSDGQFKARNLPAMLEKLRGGANMVFGWRKVRHDPFMRKLTSAVFNTMGRLYLGFPLHDMNVGIRMFDRKFMQVARVRHRINMANPELFVCAKRANLKLAEVPCEHAERNKGQSCHKLSKLFTIFIDVHRYFSALRRELTTPVEPASAEVRRAA